MTSTIDVDSRLRWLRRLFATQIALPVVQYELGVAATVASAFPDVSPSAFSLGTFADDVVAAGGTLIAHAILGGVVLAVAVLIVVLALPVRVRWFRIATFVALVFALSSAIGGLLFVLSGFRDDAFSYEMSTGFIIALVFTFVSALLMRGLAPRPATSGGS